MAMQESIYLEHRKRLDSDIYKNHIQFFLRSEFDIGLWRWHAEILKQGKEKIIEESWPELLVHH